MLRTTAPSPSGLLNIRTQNVASKILLERARSSIITTDENIEAVERIVRHDRQISVHRIAYELPIPATTVYAIISNGLGMKKVSIRWARKLLTPIQRANGVDCYQKLLQESEVNPSDYFHRIVTSDEIWVYYYDLLSQQEAKVCKKSDEETPTQLRRTRSAEAIMMIIFWNKYGILLTEYLPAGTTISGSYYASIIEQLRCVIVEKCRGKVSDEVLLHLLKRDLNPSNEN